YDLTTRDVVVVRNLSAGGFQTLSRSGPAIGDRHTFRTRFGTGEERSFRAAVVYRHRAVVNREAGWIVGWRSDDDEETHASVTALISLVTDVDFLTALWTPHDPADEVDEHEKA